MKTPKAKGNAVQYLVAAVILLAGCAVSALLLTGAIPLPFGGAEDEPADEKKSLYSVSFYDAEGQLLETSEAEKGSAPAVPAYEVEGMRFRGWDKELFFIHSDTEVHPWLESLGEDKNIVYGNAVYAFNDETVTVTPRIAGSLDCCDITVRLGYDTQLLRYTGAEEKLQGVKIEDDPAAGVVTLSWEGTEKLTEAGALAEISFECLCEGSYSGTMSLLTSEIYTLENGSKVYTDSMAYDIELFILSK